MYGACEFGPGFGVYGQSFVIGQQFGCMAFVPASITETAIAHSAIRNGLFLATFKAFFRRHTRSALAF